MGRELKAPLITGKTPNRDRQELYALFKSGEIDQTGAHYSHRIVLGVNSSHYLERPVPQGSIHCLQQAIVEGGVYDGTKDNECGRQYTYVS